MAARTRLGLLLWRIGVGVIGLIVVLGGIVLLPLPGPGWLIIFGGIGIWGTEFEWAHRLLLWARARVRTLQGWWKRVPRWGQVLIVLLCVAAVVAAFLGYRALRFRI